MLPLYAVEVLSFWNTLQQIYLLAHITGFAFVTVVIYSKCALEGVLLYSSLGILVFKRLGAYGDRLRRDVVGR